MKKQRIGKKAFGKTLAAALAAITACTALFSGFSEGIMAAEVQKTELIPTTYGTAAAGTGPQLEGYTKASYGVELVSDSNIPAAVDLAKEDAAEYGAQWLWQVFEADLNHTTIYMHYMAGTIEWPRGSWVGEVRLNPEDGSDPLMTDGPIYSFQVDAVTGELQVSSATRYLNVKHPILPENLAAFENGEFSASVTREDLPLLPDPALYQNAEAYEKMAKEFAAKSKLFGETEAVGHETGMEIMQGADPGRNEPTITIPVKGSNGKAAYLTFSRYDMKFLTLYLEPAYTAPLDLGN